MQTHCLRTTVAALALACAAPACIDQSDNFVADTGATLYMVNDSTQVLGPLFMKTSESQDWSPDLLGGTVLSPGDEQSLGVNCDVVDAVVVSQNGTGCGLSGDLCANGGTLVIDDSACTAWHP